MKIIYSIYLIFFTLWSGLFLTQGSPDTTMKAGNYTVFNREVDYNNGVAHLNALERDGILWLNNSNFKNGTIEFDVKGKDLQGQSFVGLAFHGQDNETFDGIYFRPFNFKNQERKSHSVQYISMPDNDWSTLRNAFPGKYENEMNPVPEDANDWFHVKVVINSPKVEVFVNDAKSPSLTVDKINPNQSGKVGLWVGHLSEGWFKNLKLLPE